MDFDITQNQHVTNYQFLRTLAMNGLTCKEEVMNMILKHYCDKGNADEVNYFDFCNDVDSPESIFGVGRGFNHSFDYYPKTRPRITGIDIKKDIPDDVEDALAKLRQFCKENRIRIGEFFRDFDKLRSGFITNAQFRIGLNMAKVVLSGAEFNLFCNHFAGPEDNKVRWRDFCDSVEEVFYKKGLEKDVDMAVGDARTVSFYGQAQPTNNDHDLVEQVRQMFHEQVVRERLNAKSFFQDHDRHNHFKVSPKQFKQILCLLKVYISDEQLGALTRVYGDKLRDIEYLRFLDDSSSLMACSPPEYSNGKNTYVPLYGILPKTNYNEANDVKDLMDRIKEFVWRNRIRLGEFFQDHDPLRKGIIDATKFKTVLFAQKLQFSLTEYEKLENFYRCPENHHKVRWFDFNEEVEKIFTEKDLEKFPTKSLSDFKVPSILDPRNILPQHEALELHELMSKLGTDVRYRRLLIKPFFQDKDKSNSGYVSNTRFRSIFDTMKLWITDRQYHLINKRFKAGAENEINYVEFDHVLRLYSGDRE